MLRIIKHLALTVAGAALVAGCSSDNDGSSRSSRDYGRTDTSSGVYMPDAVPGYNARQARNAQRDIERGDRTYEERKAARRADDYYR